jgi:hypothetical protein
MAATPALLQKVENARAQLSSSSKSPTSKPQPLFSQHPQQQLYQKINGPGLQPTKEPGFKLLRVRKASDVTDFVGSRALQFIESNRNVFGTSFASLCLDRTTTESLQRAILIGFALVLFSFLTFYWRGK